MCACVVVGIVSVGSSRSSGNGGGSGGGGVCVCVCCVCVMCVCVRVQCAHGWGVGGIIDLKETPAISSTGTRVRSTFFFALPAPDTGLYTMVTCRFLRAGSRPNVRPIRIASWKILLLSIVCGRLYLNVACLGGGEEGAVWVGGVGWVWSDRCEQKPSDKSQGDPESFRVCQR
jgi:hypothetical protein